MRIFCILPSGRSFEMTCHGEFKVREFAEEFSTINYFYVEQK